MNRTPAEQPCVYVVDDDEAVRSAVTLLLKGEGMAVVACASAQEFLERYRPDTAACLVLDVRMPGMSGLELQSRLREEGAEIAVIVMTGHGDIPMAVRAMQAGALDFIEKPFDSQGLIDRIRDALAVAHEARDRDRGGVEARRRLEQLTPRERQVLDLLVQGMLNKQVAAQLEISVRTVEAHRARIMDKLNARSLSDLVRLSIAVDGPG